MEGIMHYLQLSFPKIPVFKSIHRPYKVHTIEEGEILDPHALSGRKTLAFSGIANPKAFLGTLTDMGINLVRFKEYPDHYAYSDKDLCQIRREAVSLGVETIITTEKDVVRIERWPEGLPLCYLSLNIEFPDDTFETFLSRYLNKEQNTRSEIRNNIKYENPYEQKMT
jgi:tetraacyldisaccharide 4'-kinase